MTFITAIAWTTLAIIVLVFLGVWFAQSRRDRVVREAADNLMERALARFPGYANKPCIAGNTLILIMDESRDVALVASADGLAKEIPFGDFVGVRILEDGHSVAETKRKGVLPRAVVGGMVSGGAGAVIGALSAGSQTVTREIVTNITVVATTNDPTFPTLSWCLFNPVIGVEHMQAAEVQMQRMAARNFLARFQPLFRAKDMEGGQAVAI